MKRGSQSEKTTFKFIRVSGFGTVATVKGYVDVLVYGYFNMWGRWTFIVHQDTENPNLVSVSEASTGYRLQDENYYTIEDALYFAIPFIESKMYRFATTTSRVLVQTQTNLLRRNTNLQTLAIDTALWL